ncbi:hypothetical protein SUGI_0587130 [Cryptomeria japonica]|nr:hypothetical protein SUGI_0587130 [Cryptomeria japonica]
MERNGAAPFLTKTYAIVDDPLTDAIVSWSVVVKWDFVKWILINESLHTNAFLLSSIRRRRSRHNQSHGGGSQCDLEGEFQRLNEDEDAIVKEIVQLKEEQDSIDRELEEMQRRFALTEQ